MIKKMSYKKIFGREDISQFFVQLEEIHQYKSNEGSQ
jgi:hypothetical protein